MIRPEHALMDADIADAAVADGMRIINRERIIAGKMAAPVCVATAGTPQAIASATAMP